MAQAEGPPQSSIAVCVPPDFGPGRSASKFRRHSMLAQTRSSSEFPTGAGEREPQGQEMRDLDALLNSLVNVDRNSLIAILMSEAEKAEQQIRFSRHRTSAQREKHRAAKELLARIRQILSFFQDGRIAPDMIDSDIALCKSFEKKLRAKGSW